MKSFLHIIDSISEWSGKSVAFLVVVAALAVTLEVVLRYVFNAPSVYGQELVTYMCAAIYLLGGAYAHRLGAHVRVDALYASWTPRRKAIADLITVPGFFAFFAMIVWAGTGWTWTAVINWLTSGTSWDVILFPVRLLIPLSALLLLLQGVANCIRDFKIATGGHSEH